MKTIEGDLVLEKDTVFEESIRVEGNIRGKNNKRFNLTVEGDINALDIDAWDIDAWDMIFCEKVKLKKKGKIKARVFIKDRSKLERKEWKVKK